MSSDSNSSSDSSSSSDSDSDSSASSSNHKKRFKRKKKKGTKHVQNSSKPSSPNLDSIQRTQMQTSHSDSAQSGDQRKNVRKLNERNMELFISSLVSDLITYAHYQRQNDMKSNQSILSHPDMLNNMLPLELSMIIQYIKCLIWEYHEDIASISSSAPQHNAKQAKLSYLYDERLCCESLLNILNHEYAHQLLLEKFDRNISHFGSFAEYLHENAKELTTLKNSNLRQMQEIKRLNEQINELKKQKKVLEARKVEVVKQKQKQNGRQPSHSLPRRAVKPTLKHQDSDNGPLPVIERIDIQAYHQSEAPPPPPNLPGQESLWQPLEEIYELFEPRQKERKKFQRTREGEAIPPPPKKKQPPAKKPAILKRSKTDFKPLPRIATNNTSATHNKNATTPPIRYTITPKGTNKKRKSLTFRIVPKDKPSIKKFKPQPTKIPPVLSSQSKSLDPNYALPSDNTGKAESVSPSASITSPTNHGKHPYAFVDNAADSDIEPKPTPLAPPSNDDASTSTSTTTTGSRSRSRSPKKKHKKEVERKDTPIPGQHTTASIDDHRRSKKKSKHQSSITVPLKPSAPQKPPPAPPTRVVRTMTLSRPAKLESLSQDEFMSKYLLEMSKTVGQGSFAKIYRCKKKNKDTILAMKIVKKQKANKEDVRAMRREISALALVRHKNVIKIHDWCETPEHIFIVLDYCSGGNVFDRIMEQTTFTEHQASKLVKQVASALHHIHSLGIIHRDLKPENLMFVGPHDNTMKVIDFGLSNRIKINGVFVTASEFKMRSIVPETVFSLETPCGTPHYAAPELVKNQKYGAPVDLWSLGVVTYMLLCGFPPFFDTNIKNMFYQIKKAKFHFPSPFWDTISDQAKDLISKLLVLDARQRFTATQVLGHPWITGECFEEKDYDALIEAMPPPPELPPGPAQPQPPTVSMKTKPVMTFGAPPPTTTYTPPLATVESEPNSLQDINRSRSKDESEDLDIDGKHELMFSNDSMDTVKFHLTSPKKGPIMSHHDRFEESQEMDDRIFERARSSPLSTAPVPFHIESELFPDAAELDGFQLNRDETKTEPRYRKSQTVDGIETARRKQSGHVRPRINTRGQANVAYMVDGTIFQIQKHQINKLKLEIQKEQQNLEKLSNQLQMERQQFLLERQKFEQEREEWQRQKQQWLNEHEHLSQLKLELNDVVNKYLSFKS